MRIEGSRGPTGGSHARGATSKGMMATSAKVGAVAIDVIQRPKTRMFKKGPTDPKVIKAAARHLVTKRGA